ncbi:hypothetical protein HMPREF2712_08085 [Rothia sp. HMSC064F07]|nr:hypothetical protein HMPREF2712_08085 [Rothia sp. HMSC064F07]
MKVPPKRKGNVQLLAASVHMQKPSMKVPPKRKGNLVLAWVRSALPSLNESPSEKEGKLPASPV